MEGPHKKEEFLRYLKDNPMKDKRSELLGTFDSLVKGSDTSVVLISEFFRGVQNGFNSILPEDKKAKSAQLYEEYNEMKIGLSKSLKSMMVESLHFIYKDLSNNDLNKYINLNRRSKILQKVHPLYLEGIKKAFSKSKNL